MKKITKIAVCCLVALLMLSSTMSDTRAQKHNDLSIDFINLFEQHYVSLQYEFSLSDESSLALRLYFAPKSSYTNDYAAPGIGAAYRFYITNDRAVSGFNLGPAVDAFFFSNSNTNRSTTVLSIGGDVAYKLLAGHFSAEPQLSLRFGAIGDYVTNYSGAYVYGSVYLGYAW